MFAVLLALTMSADAGSAPPHPKASVLLATSPEAVSSWANSRSGTRRPQKDKGLTDSVKINERLYLGIALEGYVLPRSRKVDLTADITITDPTGRVVLEKASVATANTFDPKTQHAIILQPLSALLYGVTDPEGIYTVRVTVWDQIRGEPSKATAQFKVTR